jgi:hypothetical protein
MLRRIGLILPALIFAFGILFISVMRTAAIKYDFSGPINGNGAVLGEETERIEYNFAYPGKILPDNTLWPLKALRDKIWILITTNSSRKAELKLLFADKRIASSKILFEREKYDIGFSTLTKAEKYLEEASNQEIKNRKSGLDTTEFLRVLAYASLKHREVIREILEIAPEDARPMIIQLEAYPKGVYEKTRHAMNEKGLAVPESPFEGD